MDKSGLVSHARRVNSVLRGQAGELCSGIDQYVARSWNRCANDYKLDPLHPGQTFVLQSQHVLERIDAAGELLRIATEESRNIYSQTRGSGYVIVVTDSDGVILSWIGDPTLDEQFAQAGLRTGAIWDERHKGTNGMGTCLAEGRAVTIHNEDHYFANHASLTCTGVPIRNTSGELAAILDASSTNARGDKTGQIYTSALLQMSAKRIEHWFFLKSFGNEIVLRLNQRTELIGTIDDALIAMDFTGRILAVNEATLYQLQVPSRHLLIGRNLEDILSVRLEQILAAHHETGNIPATIRAGASDTLYSLVAKEPSHNAEITPWPVITKSAAASIRARSLDDIAGTDPGMKANVSRARSVVNKAVPILLAGETGTGKNAFARALHNECHGRDQPFVSINCAAISMQELESELFHFFRRSSLSSAHHELPGKRRVCGWGTLFLDEIGEMSQELQSKFLKLLESPVDRGSWTDSGSRGGLHIISATKTNLVERIEQAAFRKDLYYRLYGLQLELVPLAKRADKEQMIYNVLDEENKSGIPAHFSEAALERLLSHPWEGNFIELHLALRTALAMADGDEIRVEHLPAAFGLEYEAAPDTDSHALDEQSERSALVAALQRNRWNVSKTSARLKVSRNTLYRKMKELRIPKKTD